MRPLPGLGGSNPGDRVLFWTTAATVTFVIAAVAAVLVAGPVRLVAVAVDVVLFGAGSMLFLAAFAVAVARSRTEHVTLGATFLLAGAVPPLVRRRFWALLAIQVVVALAAASIRPYTAVAFAVLAPMSVFGAMAWYGARYGGDVAGDATARPD